MPFDHKTHVDVVNRRTGEVLVRQARWCASRASRLRGLQYRRRLDPGEALILVHPSDSIFTSSIHKIRRQDSPRLLAGRGIALPAHLFYN